ncbi:hypothetical protein BSKO_09268 [Bryopsis sp. KO-2023]|nr:hypothetical protein BSKO_09268 [Bryopsis sp. KO-2023]
MQVGVRGDLVVGSTDVLLEDLDMEEGTVQWYDLKEAGEQVTGTICLVLRSLKAPPRNALESTLPVPVEDDLPTRATVEDALPTTPVDDAIPETIEDVIPAAVEDPLPAAVEDPLPAPVEEEPLSELPYQPPQEALEEQNQEESGDADSNAGEEVDPVPPLEVENPHPDEQPLEEEAGQRHPSRFFLHSSIGAISGVVLGALFFFCSSRPVYYEVEEGDTLSCIGDCCGRGYEEIYKRNKSVVAHPDVIFAGDRIRIK